MGKLACSREVLEPKKGADHYQIVSHAKSPSIMHFLLRTAGSMDFLFLNTLLPKFKLGSKPL